MTELELIYVWHEGLQAGAWIPRSALRQHGLQGYIQAEPPAPPEPDDTDSIEATEPTTGADKPKSRRARGSDNTEEKD